MHLSQHLPWQQGFITYHITYPLNGGTIREPLTLHYWRLENPGKPKLLFLHGWAEFGLDMERLAEPFAADFDILAPDARAHGFSGGPPSQYTIRERTDDVQAVLAGLEFFPCVLIGHSMGANIGAGLSIEHPDWINALVLIDPSWGGGLEVMNQQARDEAALSWERTLTQWERFSEAQLLRFASHNFPGWHARDHQRWVEGKKMLNRNTLAGYYHAVPMWDDYIERIPCPGVLITGDPDNSAVVTAEKAAASQARWQGLKQVIHIPGADHYVHHHAVEPIQNAIHSLLGED